MTTAPAAAAVVCAHCGRTNRVPAVAKGVPRCGNCHNPLPWTAEATDADFAAVVESAALPVIVDLWAPWCGPCRWVSPALDRIAQELAGKIKLVKVNVDASPGISRRFEVQSIPTLLVMRGSEVVARQIGAMPAPALRQWVDGVLAGQDAGQRGQSAGQTASGS